MNETTQIEIIQPRQVKVGRPNNIRPFDKRKPKRISFSQKEKKFINNYLSGMSCFKSAQEAGYAITTCTVSSSVILRNPRIAAEIERRTKKNLPDVTADMIQREAWKLASSNILDYITIDDKGGFKVDLSQIDRDLGSAIQELGFDPQGNPKIRLVDKKASLELMARLKKMLSDKGPTGFGGDTDGQPLTIEKLDNIVNNNITINQQFNLASQQEADLLLEQ